MGPLEEFVAAVIKALGEAGSLGFKAFSIVALFEWLYDHPVFSLGGIIVLLIGAAIAVADKK